MATVTLVPVKALTCRYACPPSDSDPPVSNELAELAAVAVVSVRMARG